jgi:hypothetical protein
VGLRLRTRKPKTNEAWIELDGVGDAKSDKEKVVDYHFDTYATPILD